MSSRKFKEAWIPTPLDVPVNVAAKQKAELPRPVSGLHRVFVVASFFVAVLFRAVAVRLLPRLGRGRYSLSANGRLAREFAQRMGGMWVTMARFASLRPDLLGEAYCRELAMTRDRATPLSLGVIRRVIDEELRKRGAEIDEVLSEIDERPLNTKTFCQFHKARLKESGRWVVLRVRPPDAKKRAEIDLKYLGFFLRSLERVGYQVHMRWMDLLSEVQKATEDQLDSRAEEVELRRIAKILRPRRIYIPRIYRRYTGEALLISEHIEGVSVADLGAARRQNRDQVDQWMSENRIKLRRVGRRLLNAHLELLFEHTMFYTELLPRNVFLLRRNRIAIVSLNTVETMEGTLMRKYRLLYRALMDGNYTKVCDTFLTLGPSLPRKDLSFMRSEVIRSLRAWESRTFIKTCPYQEKSFAAAMKRLWVSVGRFGLPASWNLARLHLAEHMLDLSMEVLSPQLNFTKALRRYEGEAQRRTIVNAATKNVGKRVENFGDVMQINKQLMENFEFDGEYLRKRVFDFGGTLGRAGKIGKRIVTTLSRVAVMIIGIGVYTYVENRQHLAIGPDPKEGLIGRVLGALPDNRWVWLVILGALFYVWRLLRDLNKQLSKAEIRPVGSR